VNLITENPALIAEVLEAGHKFDHKKLSSILDLCKIKENVEIRRIEERKGRSNKWNVKIRINESFKSKKEVEDYLTRNNIKDYKVSKNSLGNYFGESPLGVSVEFYYLGE